MLALKRGLYRYEGALNEEESFAVLRGALPELGGGALQLESSPLVFTL